MNKQEILQNAPNVLNNKEQPWEIHIEGDSIIGTWKWMDATFFGTSKITDEEKEYKFIVTLNDNGKWIEKDYKKEKETNVDFSNGKISFGTSSFNGNTTQKSFQIGIGRNNQTNETGIVSFKFDTNIIKEPIRNYLKANGYKKKGLFW